jgi:hypothetical protein
VQQLVNGIKKHVGILELAGLVEFTFAPRDGATLMTMVQWGFPSDELRDEHGRGLPHAFDRLARAL